MKRVSWKLVVSMVLGISIVGVLFDSAFASESELPSWQLVYVKSEKCKTIDDQTVREFSGIVTKYLEEYQFENVANIPKCMSIIDYENTKTTLKADLLIIIFDPITGSNILGSKYLDGIYAHQGNDRSTNHQIFICDCPNYFAGFESPLPSWVLSHELSHFVLSYKGYTHASIQQIVHEMDDKYRLCIGTTNAKCDDILIRISPASSSKNYHVMKPYEAAIGNKITKYYSDDILNEKLVNMQKEYTKLWVSNVIDDQTYVKSILNLIDSPVDNPKHTANTYMSIPNGFVIADISKSSPIGWHDSSNQFAADTREFLLNNLKIVNEVEEDEEEKIPTWFKTRARLWSLERISDNVFFSGVEHLIRDGVIKIN